MNIPVNPRMRLIVDWPKKCLVKATLQYRISYMGFSIWKDVGYVYEVGYHVDINNVIAAIRFQRLSQKKSRKLAIHKYASYLIKAQF